VYSIVKVQGRTSANDFRRVTSGSGYRNCTRARSKLASTGSVFTRLRAADDQHHFGHRCPCGQRLPDRSVGQRRARAGREQAPGS